MEYEVHDLVGVTSPLPWRNSSALCFPHGSPLFSPASLLLSVASEDEKDRPSS